MNNKMPMLSRIIAGVAVVVIFIVIIIAYTLQGGYHSLSFTKKEPCQFEENLITRKLPEIMNLLVDLRESSKTILNRSPPETGLNMRTELAPLIQRLHEIKSFLKLRKFPDLKTSVVEPISRLLGEIRTDIDSNKIPADLQTNLIDPIAEHIKETETAMTSLETKLSHVINGIEILRTEFDTKTQTSSLIPAVDIRAELNPLIQRVEELKDVIDAKPKDEAGDVVDKVKQSVDVLSNQLKDSSVHQNRILDLQKELTYEKSQIAKLKADLNAKVKQHDDLVESHQLLKTQLNQKSDTSNVEEGLEDIKQRLDAIKNSRGLTIPDDSMPDVYFKVVNKKLIPVTIAQILTENHCVKQSTTSNNNAQQPRAPAQKQQQQAPQADENEDEVDEDLDEEEPVKEISPPRHQPQPKQTLVIKQSDRRYQLVYPDTTVSLEQLDRMYQSKVTTIQVKCRDRQRFGSQGDGGWDVCMDSPFTLKKPCLVYSFGINWDFQFDDAVDRRAQCEVHCFDPSMNSGDFRRSNNVMFYNLGISGRNGRMNGWNVKTLKQIMKDLGHSDRIIDYLKIDVEYSEWDSIETMLKDGTLRHQVKQLGIEYHLPELNQGLYGRSTRLSLGREIAIFNTLEQHGFKLYFSHMNPTGGFFSSITRTDKHCCNEVYYINTNFK